MTTIKRFLTLFLIATLSLSVWGADQKIVLTQTSLGITATSYTSSDGSATVGGVTFAWDKIIRNGSNMQLQANTGVLYNTTAIPGTIKSIAVTHDGTARSSTIYFGTSAQPTGNSSSFSGTATITPSGNYTYFKIQRSGNAAYWTQVEITYTPTSSCTNTPTMSFTNTTVNKTTADNTYTQAVNISGKGSGQSVSYSSSDESIATVNSSGVVTLKSKVGTTTITASVEASGTYCSASASYTLNVTQAPIDVTLHYKGTTAILDDQTNPYTLPTTGAYVANACDAWVFDGWYGSTYAKSTTKPTYITQRTSTGSAYAVYKHIEEGGSGSSDVDFVFADIASSESWGSETDGHNNITISPVNISVSKGSASYCGRWWSDNTWRIYSGNKITITTTSGEITAVSSTPSRTFTIAEGKATLTASSRIDFTSITVTYSTTSTTYYSTTAECLEKVQTPTFDVAGGSYTAAQSVTISSATTGATIYYTLDGTDPTTSSTLYTGAVTIPKGAQTTLKAIATKSDMANSDIASATYDIRVYDIVLSRSGVTENIANVVHGTTIASIAGSGDQGGCSDYPFAGWSATAVADNSSSYTAASTITAAGTYYAVYSHTTTGSGSETYNFTQYESLASAVTIVTGVTATFNTGSGSTAPSTQYGDEVRVYGNNTITIQGTGLTSITFTYTGTKTMTPSVGSISAGVWTGAATNEVTFTLAGGSGNNKITAITVGGGSTTVYSSNSGCCDDVPHDITVIPSLKSAKILWSATAATATVRVYSDAECSSMVDEKTGVSSPVTFDGLSEETTYYAKVWAGGTCASAAVSFTTLTASVEIAEWFPDSIRIVLDEAESTATVLIENKQEQSSTSTNLATDIFFSKYFEAAGFTKLVGLYNGTDHDIDISDLRMRGGTTSWSSTMGNHNFVRFSQIQKLCDEYGDGTKGHPIMLPAGTEIILYSLVASNKSDFTGADCMDEYVSWDEIAANTKPNWYRIGVYEAGKTEGNDDDGHNTLNFSGPYSLSLERNTSGSYWKMIDLIGAGTFSAPTNANTQKLSGPMTLGNGTTITVPNDKEGFYTLDGMSPSSESYPEGYSTYLSTNLCLLIRKNHVTSGDSAVLNNEDDFLTIGPYTDGESKEHPGEWLGIPIGNDGGSAAKSCRSGQQFGYVGTFDYNDFFAQYEAITSEMVLDGQAREDGTYNIPIPNLDELSCSMLRIKVSEGGVEKVSQEYKVPIMVEAGGTVKTNDAIFKKHEVPTCKECDVVILKDAVLEKTNGADDRDEVRNLTIYPGGTLVVPEGKGDYTVQSVRFRVEDEKAPAAKLKGNLITKDEQVTVTRRINNDRYYFFSLPYDCNIADIRWSNGQTPVRGVDYQIVEYDGENRAIEGSGSGVGAHWKPVSGTQLKAGKGYNIAVSTKYLRELVFPMAINTTDLTAKENGKANTVAIHQYDGTSTINNHNWNLVAHPYVSAFSAYEGSTIEAGWLKYTEPANPGDKGTWSYESETSVYLTMPSFQADKITYTQTLSTDISSLDPFLAVFVQGASEGDLTFAQSGRKLTAPARHLAAKAENEDESIFVGVTLSGNEQSDQTNVRIRPDFTEDYQLGYDLEKFITFYTPRPQVYMKTPENRLAFQAVSDDVAKSSWMPMGVYCYEAGTYTFALSDHYPTDEVEAVYLQDKTAGITTNLLYDTYSITTTKQLYTNTRFALNVIVRRKTPQITTGTEQIVETEAPRKILINGHVFIQRGGVLYDITGKQMLNH